MEYENEQELVKIYNRPLYIKKCIQELQGIATAIIYDNYVDDNEIRLLIEWIGKHREISDQFPICELVPLIQRVIKRSKCTPSIRTNLFEILSSFASDPQKPKVIDSIHDNCEVEFKDREFVFTGKLEFGARSIAIEAVERLNGYTWKAVRRTTDYLVTGNLGSDSWKFSRFGNKIEKALEIRKLYRSRLKIITERDFIEAVLKAESKMGL